jgi:hypothetical protein
MHIHQLQKQAGTPIARAVEAGTPSRHIGWVAAFTFVSWLGEAIHNRADLPQLSMLSPETTIPAMISLLLFVGWWLLPGQPITRLALLSWTSVNLVGGGILSVIPLPFWPFHPEQTVFHYLMHVEYVLTQIPLIVILLRQPSGRRLP